MKYRHPFRKRKWAGWVMLYLIMATTGASFALPSPVPDPFHPDPGMLVVATAVVDSTVADGHVVRNLPAGRYEIFANGGYAYFTSRSEVGVIQFAAWADAECSQIVASTSRAWVRRQPFQSIDPTVDFFDLYVDDKNVEWNLVGQNAVPEQGKLPNQTCDQNDAGINQNPTDPTKHVPRTFWISLDWKGGDLKFNVKDNSYADNLGSFKVVIKAPKERINEELVGAIAVPAAAPNGVLTPELIAGHDYRFVVSGIYNNGSFNYQPDPNMKADAECWTRTEVDDWRNARIPEDADYKSDLLDLAGEDGTRHSQMDGNLDWIPLSGTGVPGDCATDSDRIYQVVWSARDSQFYPGPRNTTRINFKINDYHYADNSGALTLKIFKVEVLPAFSVRPDDPEGTSEEASRAAGAVTEPVTPKGTAPETSDPASAGCATYEDATCVETLTVPLYGSVTTQRSVPTGTYIIQIKGTYKYYLDFQADAECTTGTGPGVQDPVPWQRHRYAAQSPTSDILDVYVAGQAVEWEPHGLLNPKDCHAASDPASHVYNHRLEWSGGQLEFYIYDPGLFTVDPDGNPYKSGNGLTVNIYRSAAASEGQVAVLIVNSADPSGAVSPILSKDATYLFEVSGKYNYYGYGGTGFDADAECSSKGVAINYIPTEPNYSNDPGWNSQRFSQLYPGQDPLDVYIGDAVTGGPLGGGPVTWEPVVPLQSGMTPGQCADGSRDPDHTYTMIHRPEFDGAVRFRIYEHDPYFYTDNTGFLTVRIFQIE